jgi:hypothetical protein
MKKLLLLFGLVMFATIFFIAGIFVANTEWFNETFYIPSMQMQNLSIWGAYSSWGVSSSSQA